MTNSTSHSDLPPSEIDWIVEELTQLIEREGPGPFISAPLVVANPIYFPDPWTADADGVALIVRRSLALAGLLALQLIVRDREDEYALAPVSSSELCLRLLSRQSLS